MNHQYFKTLTSKEIHNNINTNNILIKKYLLKNIHLSSISFQKNHRGKIPAMLLSTNYFRELAKYLEPFSFYKAERIETLLEIKIFYEEDLIKNLKLKV